MTEGDILAQNDGQSALSTWGAIVQTPELVDYFRGVFNRVAITVAETGEQLTVHHEGDQIDFAPGGVGPVDFRVTVTQQQVDALARHTADGRIDPAESWRIVRVLFTPMTEETLRVPVLSNPLIRFLAGVESRIHVHLLNPEGGDAATHTLIFEDGLWRVVTGLEDQAGRVYRLTPDQALAYQRHVFQAIQRGSSLGWWQFALWYRRWRRAVSTSRN